MNIINTILAAGVIAVLLTILVLACAWLAYSKRVNRHPHAANIGEGTTPGGQKTYLSSAAITTRFLFVEFGADARHCSVCNGTTDKPIGVCTDEAAAAEEPVNVALLGSSKSTLKVTAAGVIALGDYIATTAAGKAQTAASTQYVVGRALQAAAADGDVIEFDPISHFAALA